MSYQQSCRPNPPPQPGPRSDFPISSPQTRPDSVSRRPPKTSIIKSAERRHAGTESPRESVARSRKSTSPLRTQPKPVARGRSTDVGLRRSNRNEPIAFELARGASSGTSEWLRACPAAVAAEASFSDGQWKHALKALLQLRSLPGLRPIDQRWIDRQIELCQERIQGGTQ